MPVFAERGGQIGRATSRGWSPLLKQAIALASVPPSHERTGSRVEVEWTVEGRRGRVRGTVVELPFLDLPRKRAVAPSRTEALPRATAPKRPRTTPRGPLSPAGQAAAARRGTTGG